mgnify:CR=1 FL=1
MKKYNVTDSEVIKALEYCIADRIECDKCALQDECESNPFYSTIAKYALDLLKRQKTEIERLKSMNQAKIDCIHDLQNENEILSRNADTALITDKEVAKVTTNFEKIKSMTLEEMAESANPFFACPYGFDLNYCKDRDCIKCTKRWLERKVED